jgi:hypothetical protein
MRQATSNRQTAEAFAKCIYDLLVAAGAERSTAHYCAAEWWKAIERGDFG